MAPFQKTVFTTGVTPASAAELNNLGDGIVEAQRAAMVTALPTTGPGGGALADGQECYYVPDSVNQTGVVWHLKYRSADSKWWFVGGTPVRYAKLASAGFDVITSAAYANLPTSGAGAKVTLPLAGDYSVVLSALGDTPVDGQQTYLSFKIGATVANDDWAIRWRSGQLQSNAGQFRINGVAAASDLLLQGKATQTGGRVQECAILAHPIRVS